MEKTLKFLSEIERFDLASLLRYSTFRLASAEMWFDVTVPVLEIVSPAIYTEALSGLPEWDQKRIMEAIVATRGKDSKWSSRPERLLFESTAASDIDILYPEIVIHMNQMVAVSTGKARIQDFNDYYLARHKRIAANLQSLGIANPNPHADLWDWYRKWKAEFSSWTERRNYVNGMYAPLIKKITDNPRLPAERREPTGWERVDRGVEKVFNRLAISKHEEDFQAIGLLCREVIISLGQAVYEPKTMPHMDGVVPSDTDAGRMIECYLGSVAAGGGNENVRKHAKASLQLAVGLQHKRTANFRDAALCIEATASIVNILAIISGRRDPVN